MVKPQQPELRRTGFGGTSQDGREINAGKDGTAPAGSGATGGAPASQAAGWQDKGEPRPAKKRSDD